MPSDLAFTTNARTGRLDVGVAGGQPSYDESRLHKVMSRLAAVRGAWWADKTGQRGSRIGTVKNLQQAAAGDFEAYAREAMAPLVTAGEILPPIGEDRIGIDVQLDRARGRAVITVRWSTSGGGAETVRYALVL